MGANVLLRQPLLAALCRWPLALARQPGFSRVSNLLIAFSRLTQTTSLSWLTAKRWLHRPIIRMRSLNQLQAFDVVPFRRDR
jgi:hypothetical protein